MAIAFALAAALLFALGSAFQRRVAVEGSSLLALVRRPPWLVGIAADSVGYAAQAAALAFGRLAVVQPLLVSTLVFALPLERRRVQRAEWAAAVAVAAGLALFVTVADPAGGRADGSPAAWAATFAVCGVVCVSCRRGAVALACATGVLFGLSAALTKVVVGRLDDGVVHALLDWHVLALLVVGALSLERSQASLRAGSLGTAVAGQMAFDAITSLLIGVFAFGERLHASTAATAVALAGLAVALAGIAALATLGVRQPSVGSRNAAGAPPTRSAPVATSGQATPAPEGAR
jgi:hypothetical protein